MMNLNRITRFSIGLIALTANVSQAIETRFEADTSLPMVYLNVAVKAGAAHDPLTQSGIGNFVGEMMLRGTKNRTKAQIDATLDLLGATLNVETRSEAIIFRGRVLATKLPQYMEIVEDIITNPNFPENEIKKLKSEIISDIVESRGKDARLGKVFWDEFLFEGHPYGKPILGKTPALAKLKRADLIRHYEALFQDRNLLVVGSGSADSASIENWANRIARNRPDSPGENPIQIVSAPVPSLKRRVLFVNKPERTQTQVYFGQVGVRLTDPSFFPMHIANHVFGGGSFSARLMTEVRVKRGWSYGAYSYFRHGIQPRSWQAYTFPATKDTPETIKLVDGMLQDWKVNGLKPEEFDFAKSGLINSAGFAYNTPAKRVENILLEKTLRLPDGFMKTYADRMSGVTRAQSNAAVKDFLDPERMSVMVLGTAKDLKPKIATSLKVPENEIRVVPFSKE